MEADVQRLQESLKKNVPDGTIRLGITEWNTTAGDWGLARARLWTLDISAFGIKEAVAISTVSDSFKAGERDVTNSWQSPERIRTESTEVEQSEGLLPYRFPPLSITCLRFQLSVSQR